LTLTTPKGRGFLNPIKYIPVIGYNFKFIEDDELRGFAPIGGLACPGATCLEYAIVAVIFRKRSLWNSGPASQVWARE